MPEKGLKTVLSFDAVNQMFKPAAHNSTADQAVEYANRLHADDGLDSRIVEQPTRHKAADPNSCSPCKKRATTATQFSTEPKQPEPVAVSDEESESE